MDFSKLPKMSNTPAPPPAAEADYEPRQAPPPPTGPMSIGAEAWISIAIGVILLLMQQNFLNWALSHVSHNIQPPTVTDLNRGSIPYVESLFFGHDLGLVLFGLVLVFDGLVLLLVRRRTMFLLGFLLAMVATAWNSWTVVRFYAAPGFGLQILPAIAVAFGGYIAIYQWRLLTTIRARRR